MWFVQHAALIWACDAPGYFPKGFVHPRVHIRPAAVSVLLGFCSWLISFVFCSLFVKLFLLSSIANFQQIVTKTFGAPRVLGDNPHLRSCSLPRTRSK